MLTEPDTSNAGNAARFLIRSARHASLGTVMEDGSPYVSLVGIAAEGGGAPVVFISSLAQHTMNLRRTPVASLLVDGGGGSLDGPRVTLLGTLRPSDDVRLKERYVAQHSGAERYAGFADFGLWRFAVERAHLVAGFGRIAWIQPDELLLPEAAWTPLADAESGIVSHMNEDHADAIALYATVLKGAAPGAWRMTGIDAEGCDLRLGGETARLDFPEPVADPESARAALVRLVRQARGGAA